MLAHFENALCCVFENIFEKTPSCGELCIVSRIIENTYKVFLSLKIFRKESVCVRHLFCFVRKKLQVVYLLEWSLLFSFFPLDNVILPLVSR